MRHRGTIAIVLLFLGNFFSSAVAEQEFDYTKYLPRPVVEAANAHQGVLLKYHGGSEGTNYDIANAILIEKDLWLTVGHFLKGLTAPATLSGSPITYNDIYLVPVFEDQDLDLVILKAAQPISDKKPLALERFVKDVVPFEDVYALSGFRENYYADSVDLFYEKHLVGFQLPFQGKIVAAPKFPVPEKAKSVRLVFIDKMNRYGASGSPLFNRDGKIVGILGYIHPGYTVVIASETVLSFLEKYYASRATTK